MQSWSVPRMPRVDRFYPEQNSPVIVFPRTVITVQPVHSVTVLRVYVFLPIQVLLFCVNTYMHLRRCLLSHYMLRSLKDTTGS